MLYLYVELRYHRQLNRICPDIPIRFYSSIGDSVRNNGGSASRIGHAMLYTFSEDSAGFAFSASRVIEELRNLTIELRERIREYFVLIDASDEAQNADVFSEKLKKYGPVIIPDESVLFTEEALKHLASYVTTIPLDGTSLAQYTGPKITEYTMPEQQTGDANLLLTIYTEGLSDPVKLLRDMIATAPAVDLSELLGDEALTAYDENSAALEAYGWYRYTRKHPDYRKDAVVALFVHHLAALSKLSGEPVNLRLIGAKPLPESCLFLQEELSTVCTISRQEKQQFLPGNISAMPVDLLDMAYLVYRVPQFIYYDELQGFFQFLDKDASFLASLGSWLYSYGILSDPVDFRSINPSLEQQVQERSGSAASKNDYRIAEFLWTKYESGRLMPTTELLDAFIALGFSVDDAFLTACYFHCDDNAEDERKCLALITSSGVREAVEDLAAGEKAAAAGDYMKAEIRARKVLHTFQRERIAFGEYRSFSLLSSLSLTKNKGDDAVVYLDYALENAVRTRYQFSILQTGIDLACVHFGIGSFDASLCAVENAEKTAKKCFAKDQEAFLLFLKGRIYFELGDYRNSGQLFQSSASLASTYDFSEVAITARVWYGRTLAHEGRYPAAEQIFTEYAGSVPEVSVFSLEASILSGHVRKEALPVDPVDIMKNTDAVPGGYARVEDRSITTGIEEYTTPIAYRVFLLYYRARFEEGDHALECLHGIEELARISYVREDPYAAMYYYFCFELAQYIPAVSTSDGTGYLSRGFKYLQKRTKEISDNTLREQFLRNPVWNSRLFRAAREHMLI